MKRVEPLSPKGCLISIGLFAIFPAFALVMHAIEKPKRDFSRAVSVACEGFQLPAGHELAATLEYLETQGLCTLAQRTAWKRFGSTGPRAEAGGEAAFDACLLLLTDPRARASEDRTPSVPRYASIPAHFAREHVGLCRALARWVSTQPLK